MAIAMVAMLAFGGTYAYFTATAHKQTSSVTTGVIRLTSTSSITASNPAAVTEDQLIGEVKFNAAGTTAKSFIFVTVTSSITRGGVKAEDIDLADLCKPAEGTLTVEEHSGLPIAAGWTYISGTTAAQGSHVFYKVVTSADVTADIPFMSALTITASPNWDQDSETAPETMGITVETTVTGAAIQYAHIAAGDTATDEEVRTAYTAAMAAWTEANK